MKVAVAGGTGSLGTLVAAKLAAAGDEVLALSRNAPRRPRPGVAHRAVDLADGAGLAAALNGVEVVVDAANRPPNEGEALAAITQRLVDAAGAAGVRHFVGVSIVGCDRVPTSYYKAKVEQEEAIAAGPVRWSLLRATQFHSLLAWAFERAARYRLSPRGSARLQPVDVAIVAARLAEVARAEPGGRLHDIAGPELATLSELARTWSRVGGRSLLPLRIPMVGKIGRPLRAGALCDERAAAGGPTFQHWLENG